MRFSREITGSPVSHQSLASAQVHPHLTTYSPQLMKVTIVGLGLIGGSMAIDIRKAGLATELIGVDINSKYIQEAQGLGQVDRILPENKALNVADLVILAIPVNTLSALLPSILDTIKDNAVVIDAGSTKGHLCRVVSSHPRRSQFVA